MQSMLNSYKQTMKVGLTKACCAVRVGSVDGAGQSSVSANEKARKGHKRGSQEQTLCPATCPFISHATAGLKVI